MNLTMKNEHKIQYFDVDTEMAWYKLDKSDVRMNKIQHMPHKGRKVNQLDMQGNFIKCHDTVTQAALEVGIERTTITRAINQVKGSISAAGYLWEYADKPKDDYSYAKYNRAGRGTKPKKVVKLDTSGNKIAEFESVTDAAKDVNGSRCCIRAVVKGEQQTHKGFIYKYAS